METKGIVEWGQREKLTNRLKTLLEGYTDGLSVPKEMIQNADDAGATCVYFMYDERENLDMSSELLFPGMRECLGPAIWAYNDAEFTDEDLKNITSLSNSIKETDFSKVGKFGHGFCSVYNLTDVPSFLSRHNFVIFDPHSKYLEKGSIGKKIDLTEISVDKISAVQNLLKPFNGVFKCSTATEQNRLRPYKGTLFRLPLRTEAQAKENEISQLPYTKTEIEKLIDIFMSNAGNLLLFTQNVKTVEFYYLASSVSDPKQAKLIFKVKKNIDKIISALSALSLPEISVLNYMSTEMRMIFEGESDEVKELTLSLVLNIELSVSSSATCISMVKETHSNTKWLLAWASGTKESLEMAKEKSLKDALPLASVAALIADDGEHVRTRSLEDSPFGFYRTSHIFCFQPMPVKTPLPVHINGSFAVALDRRQLCSKTEDDKEALRSKWNANLMSDAVCNAYILLLNSLKWLDLDQHCNYHLLWPVPQSQGKLHGNLELLQRAFYTSIVTENCEIFKQGTQWSSFSSCRFLDPAFETAGISNAALTAAIYFSNESEYMITELPENIMKCFSMYGYTDEISERLLSQHEFYSTLFFPNILSQYWLDFEDNRDSMVLMAIDSNNRDLLNLVQSCPCIPTEPDGKLQKPSELVHPYGHLKPLFDERDGRFIKGNTKTFLDDRRLDVLSRLGMMNDNLPDDTIIDRAKSVKKLCQTCCYCALERCNSFLKYISSLPNRTTKVHLFHVLGDIEFLPVLEKLVHWPLDWKSCKEQEEKREKDFVCSSHKELAHKYVQFQCPNKLFFSKMVNLVSTSEQILDESLLIDIDQQLLSELGVMGLDIDKVPIEIVVNHLKCLCTSDTNVMDITQKQQIENICHEVYKFINTRISSTYDESEKEAIKTALCQIVDLPVVFSHGIFVKPHEIAMNLQADCRPYLYGINKGKLCHYRAFLKSVGVKEHFSAEDFLRVLIVLQKSCTSEKLPQKQLQLILTLIKQLTTALQKESLVLNDLIAMGADKLLLPDKEGVLHPLKEFCTDESNHTQTVEDRTFIHHNITSQEVCLLGIKSKQLQDLMKFTVGLPFGQYQDITTRIKTLLSGYPCDSGIFKELIQNADDAGATEISFIKDFRQHGINKVFSRQWIPLQGSALCVYNDTEFSPKDIEGIQKVGLGTKADDPTTTGQFGVGFNSVYQLTDVPSFLTRGPSVDTGENLCIFDPQCLYAPGATKERPGMRYNNLPKWRTSFPDVFTGYHECLLKEKGTIFRFPLRCTNSELSEQKITEQELTKLLTEFKDEMFETLLFLNNVRKISLLDASCGNLKEEYVVEMIISDEDRENLERFVMFVKKLKQKETFDCTVVPEKTVTYTVTIKDNKGNVERWMIVQKIGFSQKQDTKFHMIQEACHNGKLKLLPRGGVAVQLDMNVKFAQSSPRMKEKTVLREGHRAFSFLPLPIKTGLPFHINGHFALDHEARRNLWREETEGFRSIWNKTLMQDVIAPAFVIAIQSIKHGLGFSDGRVMSLKEASDAKAMYHSLFPNPRLAQDENWRFLATSMLEEIIRSKADVFISLHVATDDDNSEVHVKCCPILTSNDPCRAVFNDLRRQMSQDKKMDGKEQILTQICKNIGMKLLDTPLRLYDIMKEIGIEGVSAISPQFLLKFMTTCHTPDVTDGCVLGNIDELVSNTKLKSLNNSAILLQYCMQSEDFLQKLEGLPLCVTEDLCLHTFTNASTFCTTYSDLVPASSESFLHPKLVGIFQRKFRQKISIFPQFNIHALSELIPLEFNYERSKSFIWNPGNETIPNLKWMNRLWEFLYDQLSTVFRQDESPMEKENKILQELSVLSDVPLLPCTKKEDDRTLNILLPIQNIKEILLVASFTGNQKLLTALTKLNMPNLNVFAMPATTYHFLSAHVLANSSKARDVLLALYLNQQTIEHNTDITHNDCDLILEYIADNLTEILSGTSDLLDVSNQLRALPLFVSVQGTRVRLETNLEVLVVLQNIPQVGIEEWETASRTLLLRHNYRLEAIYRFLGLAEMSSCKFYTEKLIGTSMTFHNSIRKSISLT